MFLLTSEVAGSAKLPICPVLPLSTGVGPLHSLPAPVLLLGTSVLLMTVWKRTVASTLTCHTFASALCPGPVPRSLCPHPGLGSAGTCSSIQWPAPSPWRHRVGISIEPRVPVPIPHWPHAQGTLSSSPGLSDSRGWPHITSFAVTGASGWQLRLPREGLGNWRASCRRWYQKCTTFYKIFSVLGDEYPGERNLHQDCRVYLWHVGGDIRVALSNKVTNGLNTFSLVLECLGLLSLGQ